MTTSALGAYLVDLCERHNLSMREASLRAGLSDATLSLIVRRGDDTTPRPKPQRRRIADGFAKKSESP